MKKQVRVSFKPAVLLLAAVLAFSFFACSNEMDYTGEAPSIDSEHKVITFSGGDGVDDVTFEHEKHAVYWDNNCLECHTHTDVRDDTVWGCAECHSNDDRENLCSDDANGHDCMFVQCYQCHIVQTPDPTPTCVDCHIPIYTGVFAFGPVQGLEFSTETQGGLLDDTGAFTYLDGETITFYLGDVIINSVTPRSVMTPIDLVNVASDVDDPMVTNITRFLMTLDDDGDINNGILIPNAALDYMVGISIDFTQSIAAFESDPVVTGLIDALNNAGVFSGGTRTLELVSTARSELQACLDILYPPPAIVTDAIVNGVLNTNFLLEGIYNAAAGAGWEFKWYRADDDVGTGETEIGGETTTLYKPGAADIGNYVMFEATPDAPDDIIRSDYVGPVDGSTFFTIFGNIVAQSQVDEYVFRLNAQGVVIVNVLSVEDNYTYPCCYNGHDNAESPSCKGCHDFGGDADLGFGGASAGDENDDLTTNIFIFNTTDVFIDSRECFPSACAGVTLNFCSPGCDVLGAWDTHNGRNPYISNTLEADDYVVKIGAAPLNSTDALSGTNSDGVYFNDHLEQHFSLPAQNLENYKIEFTFP